MFTINDGQPDSSNHRYDRREREIIMKICNERVTDMMGILQTVIRELKMKIPISTINER